MHRSFRLLPIAVAALFVSNLAIAQAPPPTAGQVEGTVNQAPSLKRPSQAPKLEKKSTQHQGIAAGGKKIKVKHFVFSGNNLYDDATLQDLIKDYVDRPITLSEVYDAADLVTRYYGAHGYGLASVNVPAQKISSGTVKFEVIEGRLSRITVTGNDRHRSGNILGFMKHAESGSVYQGENLQHDMRLLNELPGLKAKAVVSPGDQYGTTDIELQTQEQLLNGAVSIDNYGRQQIDEWRLTGQLAINNPFTIEDQIQLLALHTDHSHLRYYYGSYSLPLNYYGTRAQISYGRADFSVKGSTVAGYSNNTKLTFSHPLVRDFSNTLDINTSVIRNNSNTDFNATKLASSSITLWEIGASYSHIYDNTAVTQVSTTMSTDFKRRTTPPGAAFTREDQLLRWEVDAFHLQPLFERVTLLAHFNGVYSPDALADSQKFNLGGPQNVRGYPIAEVRGDRGYFGSLQVSRPINAGPVLFTPRVFVESGRVHNIDYATSPPASDTLSSAGFGTDVLFAGATFKIDYSRTLGNHAVSDGRTASRIFGALSYAF